MNGKVKIALLVAGLCGLSLLGLGTAEYRQTVAKDAGERDWHHELAAESDPTIGSDQLPSDFIVDDTFESHLPLIVIDTHGQEIVNYKYYDSESDSFRYEEGVDPYTSITFSVFDSDNYVNRLSDSPTFSSSGKIKIRGNSSSALDKKQYRLQVLDSEGNKQSAPLLGLDAGEEWVLNGSQRDYTYMRNYLSYNLAHMLDPYSPEVRYCELLMKTDDGYQYEGIYLLIEPIQQGPGRVDIEEYDSDLLQTSYLVRRDREDPSEQRVVTYVDEVGIAEQWAETVSANVQLSLLYPTERKLTPETLKYIEDDISTAEQIIYSSDTGVFRQYPDYIDVSSFVDYFILNEFVMSYDAGVHSTYMYKDIGGKLTMGPYWDFDGAMDNSSRSLTNFQYIVMPYRPYYDRLCQDKAFNNQIVQRYRQLRNGILSDEYIREIVESTAEFLGNAVERDRQRWGGDSGERYSPLTEVETQMQVDRSRNTHDGEVERLLDAMLLHGEYMDKNLAFDLDENIVYRDSPIYTLGGWLMIAAFFVSIILVQRYRKGM